MQLEGARENPALWYTPRGGWSCMRHRGHVITYCTSTSCTWPCAYARTRYKVRGMLISHMTNDV